jgi:hypothetical protein
MPGYWLMTSTRYYARSLRRSLGEGQVRWSAPNIFVPVIWR